MLVLCTVYSFSVQCARCLYRILVMCTICSFSVPYARFMYHMLVLRIICYAYSETQPLLIYAEGKFQAMDITLVHVCFRYF